MVRRGAKNTKRIVTDTGTARKHVVIPGLNETDRLRVATLSWVPRSDGNGRSERDTSYHDCQSFSEFLDSLNSVVDRIPASVPKSDLILCSGYTVYQSLDSHKLMKATDGSAILFEAYGRKRDPWYLCSDMEGKPQMFKVREQQFLYNREEMNSKDGQERLGVLLRTLAAGEGIFRFSDHRTRLMLVICGENNAFNYDGNSCVVRGDPPRRLLEYLSEPWIVLNPAHNPYVPRVRRTGFSKVGPIWEKRGFYPATMSRLVNPRSPFEKGTVSPAAYLHANRIHESVHHSTSDYCSVAFVEGLRERLCPIYSVTGDDWIYKLYQFLIV